MGGESQVKNKIERQCRGVGQRHTERTGTVAGAGRWRLLAALTSLAATACSARCRRRGAGAAADPDQRRQAHRHGHRLRSASPRMCAPTRASPTSRSAIRRWPTSTPLTDHSLSILGKKIGTTRVSVYAEGKKLIGMFDVEVSYDTSRLADRDPRRFPHAGIRVSSVNGRIMLSGTAPDAATRRQGGDDRQAVRRPTSSTRSRCTPPQQVMLEVRFVEATRQAGRELGVQWNVFGSHVPANIGNRTPTPAAGHQRLPITAPHQPRPTSPARRSSPAPACSRARAPFGFMLGTHDRRRHRRPTS